MKQLEILRGPASYLPENLGFVHKSPGPSAPPAHKSAGARAPVQGPADEESVPESRGEYAEIYSTKHDKILLRVEHITKMDAIRKGFNRSRLHAGQRTMTTSDLVNAALDFVFRHRIPFFDLQRADELPDFMTEHIYRDALSRWRQWTERF